MAVQIYNINILLDLEKVSLGGAVSASPMLLKLMQESLNKVKEDNPQNKLGAIVPCPELTVCKFRNDANLLGAWYHFKNTIGKNNG